MRRSDVSPYRLLSNADAGPTRLAYVSTLCSRADILVINLLLTSNNRDNFSSVFLCCKSRKIGLILSGIRHCRRYPAVTFTATSTL